MASLKARGPGPTKSLSPINNLCPTHSAPSSEPRGRAALCSPAALGLSSWEVVPTEHRVTPRWPPPAAGGAGPGRTDGL